MEPQRILILLDDAAAARDTAAEAAFTNEITVGLREILFPAIGVGEEVDPTAKPPFQRFATPRDLTPRFISHHLPQIDVVACVCSDFKAVGAKLLDLVP